MRRTNKQYTIKLYKNNSILEKKETLNKFRSSKINLNHKIKNDSNYDNFQNNNNSNNFNNDSFIHKKFEKDNNKSLSILPFINEKFNEKDIILYKPVHLPK